MSEKKFTRSMTDKMICGVCSGMAKYFDLDVTLVRLIFVLVTLFMAGLPGIIFYIVCAFIVPEEPLT
ncbi:MAG: PspC domain-containing protein [Bacteroidaceae bacterium]|nr:PspC domain-containing protein [Bacteroidaceae bacterium]